jgi:SAM-dependent methyltransferase
MPFSSEWEDVYRLGEQNATWPWSDLVSYVMRYAYPDRRPFRVLELGFGAGANIPLFLGLGADYSGTEGSSTAVERARARFANAGNFRVARCDFTVTIPFAGPFDLVVDRSSLTHNTSAAIRSCLRQLHGLMRHGGKLIGIDWFSTVHGDATLGVQLEDRYTRKDLTTARFHNVGTVHFSDEGHLTDLLGEAGLVLERLEHKRSDIVLPHGETPMAWWNFVAVKP